MPPKIALPVLLLFFASIPGFTQDTLFVTLRQADSLFIARNYYLLAASMNVEAHKAQELQLRLYPNPVATADLNMFDPENKRLFHVGATGQKAFQLEQLIILGGKRRAEIEMARTNTAIAALEFQNLVRELKYRLHASLFAVGQHKLLLDVYNSQLRLLDSLLANNQVQVDKGNIPVRDLVRLKGAYLKLNNDRAEILKSYYEAQTELHTILVSEVPVDLSFSEEDISRYIRSVPLAELNAIALENRPDLLIEEKNKELAEQYHAYQKKLAIPDLNLFVSYDQASGAFRNQVNAGVSMALPFWNRNQGNIRSAQFRLRESGHRLEGMKNALFSEIRNNHTFHHQTIGEYEKATRMYDANFEVTLKGMTDNFRKRNVSIVEFIDFFEAYNEVLTELVRIKIQLVTTGEELNRLTGKDVY